MPRCRGVEAGMPVHVHRFASGGGPCPAMQNKATYEPWVSRVDSWHSWSCDAPPGPLSFAPSMEPHVAEPPDLPCPGDPGTRSGDLPLAAIRDLLEEVVSFLQFPREFMRLCCALQSYERAALKIEDHPHWERMYQAQWRTFYQYHKFSAPGSWRTRYRDTLEGREKFLLEVHERHLDPSFYMSALPARVRWDNFTGNFIAEYLSASQVAPEMIPKSEEFRLRCCPAGANRRLGPPECVKTWPYKVLPGLEGLRVGHGVELQWKMQPGSPFGWWHATLDSLDREPSGEVATATLSFDHFPVESPWYRLHVRFGDGAIRKSSMGGYSGGVWGLSDAEEQRWKQFRPVHPLACIGEYVVTRIPLRPALYRQRRMAAAMLHVDEAEHDLEPWQGS